MRLQGIRGAIWISAMTYYEFFLLVKKSIKRDRNNPNFNHGIVLPLTRPEIEMVAKFLQTPIQALDAEEIKPQEAPKEIQNENIQSNA